MTDRQVLPHDFEAERALLGVAILEPKRIPDLIALVCDGDFYGDKNREIFKSIVTLAIDNKNVGVASIYEQLGGKVSATEIGQLADGLQVGADIYAYARIVKEKSGLRNIIGVATEIARSAYDGDTDESIRLITGLSAVKLMGRREHAMAEDIRKWVESTNGIFNVTDCFNSLQNVTSRDKSNVRVILSRLQEKGVLESAGKRDGMYRLVRRECDEMDWLNAPDSPIPFKLPLGLNEIISIYPKSLIVLAGEGSKGKSAFCLETIRLNMDKFPCHYFSSELGPARLKKRLSMFEETALEGWNFKSYWRSVDFQDVIRPDDINVIDWLYSGTEFFTAGDDIKKIFDKLNTGIAIIALQKSGGKEYGRGGDITQDFATLYLSISSGVMKILKAKDWKTNDSPDGKTLHFKIENASKFVTDGAGWQYPESRAAADSADKKSFRRLF